MNERSSQATSRAGEHAGENTPGASAARFPRPPLYGIEALHQTVGNQAVGRLILQSKVKSQESGVGQQQSGVMGGNSVIQMKLGCPSAVNSTCEEEEAVQTKPIAEQITPLVQRQADEAKPDEDEEAVQEKRLAPSYIQRQEENEEEEPEQVQAKRASTVSVQRPGLSTRLHNLQGGEPLPASTRAFFEPRFGADFSAVRVHTGSMAAETAQQINAQAFTRGRDIVFGQGRYQPQAHEGQRLLAHELTHTMQQSDNSLLKGMGGNKQVSHTGVHIQRDEPTTPVPITVPAIFPFPQGSRVVLSRILSDEWFDMISAIAPAVATAFGAIDNQAATITTANDDLFEATMTPPTPIQLPAGEGSAAAPISTVTVRLQRQPDGTFDFSIFGSAAGQTEPATLFQKDGLTATRAGDSIVLATGSGSSAVPQLQVTPGSAGQVSLGVYTAPYLAQLPEWVRRAVPERLEALRLTQLPEVRPGTTEERQAIESIAAQTRSQRRERRQRIVAGAGIMSGAEVDPLLTSSWQINFTPVPEAGGLFQVPLEVQLQYAPPSSLIGGVSSGIETSLSQLEIPVNIRVRAGLSGGALSGPEGGEAIPVFGPTLGVGAGLELGAFRMDLSYEHLFNLLPDTPDIDAVFLRPGFAF